MTLVNLERAEIFNDVALGNLRMASVHKNIYRPHWTPKNAFQGTKLTKVKRKSENVDRYVLSYCNGQY